MLVFYMRGKAGFFWYNAIGTAYMWVLVVTLYVEVVFVGFWNAVPGFTAGHIPAKEYGCVG